MPRGREFEQRLRHPFLLKNEIDQEEVKDGELEPKVPNRLANKQKKKEQKHSRVRHQQSPPSEHRPGRIAISRFSPADAPMVEIADEDRKSTRLNSSHLVISYAVFC